MDRRRLADVRAGSASQQESCGSGYLVGRRLVLTCRHVVAGDQDRVWPRLEVRLGHPGAGPHVRAAAEAVWVHPTRDAVLLRIVGEPVSSGAAVRWGWFAGGQPWEYSGLGFPEFADYANERGVEQLVGMLPPLGAGPDGSFVLDQGSAPNASTGRAWPGVSGAAVFCQGLLTGMVAKDDLRFGNRRLHAVPASDLIAEPEFVRLITEDTGTTPVLEAVELTRFLQPPANPTLAQTPGSLLAAGVEAVGFVGRSQELADLAAWRDSNDSLSVMLVTGEGGHGKTRLARQLMAQSRESGWAGGFLAARTSGSAASGNSDRTRAATDLAARIQDAVRPVLLVADYAEIRPEEISALTSLLAGNLAGQPIRLLLLARVAGAWWANLSEDIGPHLSHDITLGALTSPGQERRDAYAAAVTLLARHLGALPELPADRPAGQSWPDLAARLAARPPDLDSPVMGNALTLQITALSNLLDAATGRAPVIDPAGSGLVRHELGYLRGTAARRNLFTPGILSTASDDDERAEEAWGYLERALAGLILLGPSITGQADAISALASKQRPKDIVNWLAALYPPPSAEFHVGAIEPDRLSELLLGPILLRQRHLLSKIGATAQTTGDAEKALFTLTRTAAHDDFSPVGEQIIELIAQQPDPFARVAPVLATALQKPPPLINGLIALGKQNPEMFKQEVYEAINRLIPVQSAAWAKFMADLNWTVLKVVSRLAQDDPGNYLPGVASLMQTMSVRASSAGHLETATAFARDAVEVCRSLAETDPDAFLPELARSLHNLGNHLDEIGRPTAAVPVAQEAVTLYRRLADASPQSNASLLAVALQSLSAHLAASGQNKAALSPALDAVALYRKAAAADHAYLPALAAGAANLSARLAENGQPQAAQAAAQDAVTLCRQLASADLDAHLPALAFSLHILSTRLAEDGHWERAMPHAQEAVAIYRGLAEVSPDAYRSWLAAELRDLSNCLAGNGERRAALSAIQEAVSVYQEIPRALLGAHLADLATSLSILGVRLAECGQVEAALPAAQRAVSIYRPLAEDDANAHLPGLAMSLANLGARLAETGQLQAALAAASEAVNLYQPLAEADPYVYILKFTGSVHNLSAITQGITDAAHGAEVWESAIRNLSSVSSRSILSVAYAKYLLLRADSRDGLTALVRVLTTPGAHGAAETEARQLLRHYWRQEPEAVDMAWRSLAPAGLPDWIDLSGEHFEMVVGWISANTWTESLQCFNQNPEKLIAASTDAVLDELLLDSPTDLINEHRNLITAIRQSGPEVAYQKLILRDTLRQWIESPSRDTSRVFLRDHPELFGEDSRRLLASLNTEPDPRPVVYGALLTIAGSPAGVDRAYEALDDVQAMQAIVGAAVKESEIYLLGACAAVETYGQGREFSGSLHMILSRLMNGTVGQLPGSWNDNLRTLGGRADFSERATIRSALETVLSTLAEDSDTASHVRSIIGVIDEI
jgi:hypothetical protein